MSPSYIIFWVGLTSNDQNKPEFPRPLIRHSFQSLIGRLCVLGTKCVAVVLRLEMEAGTLEVHVRNDADFVLAERYFTDIASIHLSDATDKGCWIYALPLG